MDLDYAAVLYDITNGLPTSEAMAVLGASDGYLWLGGYGGVIRYDGSEFEKLSIADGLTSCRSLYEDSRKRIWVATNDNGVVVLDHEKRTHFTKEDGLPSSSVRTFAEDAAGNIYIGTTDGIAYVDEQMLLHQLDDERLNTERILNLSSDQGDTIYGFTKTGAVFAIDEGGVAGFYRSEELGAEKMPCCCVRSMLMSRRRIIMPCEATRSTSGRPLKRCMHSLRICSIFRGSNPVMSV